MIDHVALNAFALVSIFPEMASTITQWGVTGRAARDGRFRFETVDPRDFASDKHGTVDDRPYGGGPGMVMKAPTMTAAVEEARARLGSKALVIAMSPQGQRVNEKMLDFSSLSLLNDYAFWHSCAKYGQMPAPGKRQLATIPIKSPNVTRKVEHQRM